MIIVLLCYLTFIVLLIIEIKTNKKKVYKEWTASWMSAILPFLVTLLMFFIRHDFKVQAEGFTSAKATIYSQRMITDDHYERAALIQSIVEYNAWLAKSQRWVNDPVFGWFIPKEVLFLTPIE